MDAGRSWPRPTASTVPRRYASVVSPRRNHTLRFRMVSVVKVSGMIAVHSRRAVFTALAGVPGVITAEVELGRVEIVHDDNVAPETIAAAIESAGCAVTSVERVGRRTLPVRQAFTDADGT